MKPMQVPPVKYSSTRLGGGVTSQGVSYPGGLDLITPSLALQPGALRACLNFECSQAGGYSRIQGYERFDGSPAPSAALYQIIQFTGFTNLPATGDSVTQATSGATGHIIAVNNAAGAFYIAVTKVSGTFDYTHDVSVGSTLIGTATSPTISISPKTNAQYLAAAADVYRADIDAVPGSGNVLGVVAMTFSGTDYVYAFRANAGATAVNLYKSSGTGWTQVTFYKTLSFTAGGTTAPADGETITQSGVTATVKRVMQASGSWSGSSAAGTLVIDAPSGGSFTSGSATLSGGASVTLSGAEADITLSTGGRFEFDKYNFAGQSATRRIYGCDGVNKGFEFDGDVLAPITTGLTDDSPSHVRCHKNYLIFSKEGSLVGSAPGSPYKWTSTDGAWEIATGDLVTAMVTLPGDQNTASLAVYGRSNTYILYGTDTDSFNFVPFNTGAGALEYSVQNLFDTFAFDDLGVITLRATLNFGNFNASTLTANIQPFIKQERNKLTASSISRGKSQYRAFFSDGYGLWLTIVNQQYLGAAITYFPNPVFVCDQGTNSLGDEVTYFASNDGNGYVYQMDKGTSFDGASVDAYFTMAWDAQKSPRINKRYRGASLEVQGNTYAEMNFGYQIGYASSLIGQSGDVGYASNFAAPYWDSFSWDNFVWDGQNLLPTWADMVGTGENVQVTIRSTGNYIDAFTVNSVIFHYTPRRGLRDVT